jgi:hypothetical protein
MKIMNKFIMLAYITFLSSLVQANEINADYLMGGFNTTSCAGEDICIAAGYYVKDTSYPLLAQGTSDSSWTDWTYLIDSTSVLPEGFQSVTNGSNNNHFINTNCSDTVCAAAGFYADETKNMLPMVAVSIKNGNFWSAWQYQIDKKNLPKDFVSANSYSDLGLSCTTTVCVLAGGYSTADNYIPMIAVSTYDTSKQTWSAWEYQIQKDHSLPPEFKTGEFQNVSCSEHICAAAGYYLNHSDSSIPMLAISQYNAETQAWSPWEYRISIDTPEKFPDHFKSGSFDTISCSADEICIVAGTYTTKKMKRFPMLAVSTHNSDFNNWTYSIDSQNLASLPYGYMDADAYYYPVIKTSHCSGGINGICAMGGFYYSDKDHFPMLAVSTDSGKTWGYSIDGTQVDGVYTKLPLDYGFDGNYPPVESVSCLDKNICTATGRYGGVGNPNNYPFVAVSIYDASNGWSNWAYKIDSTSLPQDSEHQPGTAYASGLATSCIYSGCIMAGYYSSSSLSGMSAPMLSMSIDQGETWDYLIDAMTKAGIAESSAL